MSDNSYIVMRNEREPLAESVAQTLADTFKTLADPTRLRIVEQLLAGERCVHEITEVLGLEQSAVSHQLRKLRDRALVHVRRDGRHIFYSLADEHVRALFEMALDHVRHTSVAAPGRKRRAKS